MKMTLVALAFGLAHLPQLAQRPEDSPVLQMASIAPRGVETRTVRMAVGRSAP